MASVDSVTFEAFIANKVLPNVGKNTVIIIDNARIHKSEMLRTLLAEAGVKLIYLSPYSPEFSQGENFWSKVKHLLKKMASRNYKTHSGFLLEAN